MNATLNSQLEEAVSNSEPPQEDPFSTEAAPLLDFSFLLEGVMLFTVALFGLFGNGCAMLIFSRQRVQKNFHSLMVALAAFDVAYILSRYVLAHSFVFPLNNNFTARASFI